MRLKVTVKYFGSVKDEAGTDQELLEIDDGSTISDVVSILKTRHDALGKRRGQILFALNQSYTTDTASIKSGDELALFPVVSGG